jgi:hypothetical protein
VEGKALSTFFTTQKSYPAKTLPPFIPLSGTIKTRQKWNKFVLLPLIVLYLNKLHRKNASK